MQMLSTAAIVPAGLGGAQASSCLTGSARGPGSTVRETLAEAMSPTPSRAPEHPLSPCSARTAAVQQGRQEKKKSFYSRDAHWSSLSHSLPICKMGVIVGPSSQKEPVSCSAGPWHIAASLLEPWGLAQLTPPLQPTPSDWVLPSSAPHFTFRVKLPLSWLP